MTGEQHDAVSRPGRENLGQHPARLGVQATAGAIRNDDGRRAQRGGGQVDLAPRARGHLLKALVQMRLQPQAKSQIQDVIVQAHVFLGGGVQQEFAPGLRGKRQAVIRHVSQAGTGLLRRVGQRMPVDPYLTAIRRDHARDDAQQTGFAGAVFFAQRHASRRERVSQPLEYKVVAIALAEIVDA